MPGTLHVVFCLDTEGPLYESLESHFQRLERIFGISLPPTAENLERLRRGDIPGVTDETQRLQIAAHFDPRYANLGDWTAVRAQLERITSPAFRNQWRDAEGQGIAFSWFCMDHVGVVENPRRRALGHHAVFDIYRELLARPENTRDTLQFHYHPLPYNRKAHASATYYLNGNHLMGILARKVIERTWFPSVYRPGFHTERPDSHWFLEQWIPFDYANQAYTSASENSGICADQFGDWRRAPQIWGGYHPHHDDYQREGRCRRWIFRSLNAYSRVRNITQADMADACAQAAERGTAVLAVTNHDYKQLEPSLRQFYDQVCAVARSRHVELRFSDALTAARAFAGLQPASCGLEAELEPAPGGAAHILRVHTQGNIFGPQPFLAVKTAAGFFFDNLDVSVHILGNSWSYTFCWDNFPLEEVECIGIAAPTASGTVDIIRIFPREKRQERTCLS